MFLTALLKSKTIPVEIEFNGRYGIKKIKASMAKWGKITIFIKIFIKIFIFAIPQTFEKLMVSVDVWK